MKLFVLIVLLSSQFAFTFDMEIFRSYKALGGDMSGGGYIVVCKDRQSKKESYELLDYFEAKHTLRSFKLDNFSSYQGIDAFEKAKTFIIKRLGPWSEHISSRLVGIINDFEHVELNFVTRAVITDIDDSDTLVDPEENCFKKQIAVQVKKPTVFQYRVLVDRTAWQKLDLQTQVGLILHEAIYKIAMDQGHINSKRVRFLNAVLSTDWKLTSNEILSLFQYSEINTCVDKKVSLSISRPDRQQDIIFPLKSSTLNISNGHFSGDLCFAKEYKIFDESLLTMQEGVRVTYEPVRPLSKKKRLILSGLNLPRSWSSKLEPTTSGLDLVYSHSSRRAYYHSYFEINPLGFKLLRVGGAYPNQLSLYNSFPKSIDFSLCQYIKFIDSHASHWNLFWGCTPVEGSFLFRGQVFRIASLRGFSQKNLDAYIVLESNVESLVVLGETLRFGKNVAYRQEENSSVTALYIFSYNGVKRNMKFQGREFKIQKGSRFIFNSDEELIEIVQ